MGTSGTDRDQLEVVDLRTLRPLDLDTVLSSVAKTNRVAVVEEGPLTGGWAGEMLALITEHGLGDLDDAWRIATPNTPIPYSPPLEDAHLPGPEQASGRGLFVVETLADELDIQANDDEVRITCTVRTDSAKDGL